MSTKSWGGSNKNNPWTTSNLIMDYHRLGMRPTPSSKPTATPPDDVKVSSPAHVSIAPFEKEVPLGKGFYTDVKGPNASFGVRHDKEMTSLDAQANVGSVGIGHRNDNHDVHVGYNYGWNGGVRMHHGEKPGFGFDAGPVTFDARSKSLATPVKSDPMDPMFNLFQ